MRPAEKSALRFPSSPERQKYGIIRVLLFGARSLKLPFRRSVKK